MTSTRSLISITLFCALALSAEAASPAKRVTLAGLLATAFPGVAARIDEALASFEETAVGLACRKANVARSCAFLAARESARGNRDAAEELHEAACDGGVSRSCLAAALLAEAAGRLPDAEAAYRDGCSGKIDEACLRLGGFYLERRKIAAAKPLIERFCGNGRAVECAVAAEKALALGARREALAWAEIGCDRGEARGCFLVGLADERAGNLEGATQQYRAACATLDDACLALARVKLALGHRDEARDLVGPLCRPGAGDACALLGEIDQRSARREGAIAAYRKGCDAGNATACSRLGNLQRPLAQVAPN